MNHNLMGQYRAVVGYRSYTRFHEELPMDLRFQEKAPAHETLSTSDSTAFLFRWEFLVPEGSHLTDTKLLDRAVRLSRKSEFRDSRRQFHEWPRRLIAKQVSIETARLGMDRCLRVYNDVVDKKRKTNFEST
jgi:hypothetical protein